MYNQHAPRVLINSGSYVLLEYRINYIRISDLSSDPIFKNAIATRIQKIVFRYDPNNSVNGYGSYKHYDAKIEDNTLFITVNIDKWNSDLYSFEDVCENATSF